MKKILLVGGGTGGHITPLLAVARKLKQRNSDTNVYVITDNNHWVSLLQNSHDIDKVIIISAGKLRRYPNETLLRKLLDIKTIALNIRDVFRTIRGYFQAKKTLKELEPDIIFIKGGFVGVPVGCAAHGKRIKFITHDSDTVPGLANRLISRWATIHAVGMPVEYYAYPRERTVQVGTPLHDAYKHVGVTLQKAYRQDLHVPENAKVIAVTGGSLGAERLNLAISKVLNELLDNGIYVFHQTGANDNMLPPSSDKYQRFSFKDDLYKVTGAADVVIARTGASTLAELAVQGRAVITVPSPYLAGGHQLKNAQHLHDNNAVLVLQESELQKTPRVLIKVVNELFNDSAKRETLARNLTGMFVNDAADKIADLIEMTSKVDHESV